MRNWIAVLVTGLLVVAAGALQAQNLLNTRPLSLARELTINGSIEDFVPIGWLVVGRDGRMAIQQNQDKAVLFYDAMGKRLGKFGSAGEGPREFQRLSRAGLVGDTLWIYDLLSRRATFILPPAEFVREVPLPDIAPAPADASRFFRSNTPTVFAAYSDGSFLTRIRPNEKTATPQYSADQSFWFRFNSARVIQTFVGASFDQSIWVSTSNARGGGSSTRLPFLAEPSDTMSYDGQRRLALQVFVSGANANTYSLTVLSASGDTLVKSAHPFEAVPLPRARLDSAYDAIENRGNTPRPPEHLARIRAARVNTPVLPPTFEAFLGVDYSIWLRVRAKSPSERVWIVFDPSGNPVGHLRGPASMLIKAASMRQIWVVENDADDVPSIVRYGLSGMR